jgi:acetyl-CoA carboxylase biotin carboxyl carrier protein
MLSRRYKVEVRAPLAEKIIKIETAVGATVQEDDEIFVLESMKMEAPIYSPCSGNVSGIHVKEGEKVQEDQLIATID